MCKMKDSGIPWLGFVNERYQVIRLKYIADVLDQYRQPITADKRNQNSDILYDYYGASGAIDKIDGYTIDDHVMLIGEDGANLRMRNLPLMYEVNGKAWINNHAHILKPKAKTDFYYLFYALESLDINPYVTGSAQPKLNQESLKNIVLPYPSLPEQKKIADFLDAKCADIDQIRADIEKQIEILTDYKKSIITEAVTKGLDPKAKMKDSGIEWIGKIPEHWSVNRVKYLVKKPLQYGANESGTDFDESNPRYIRITDITMDNKLKEDGKLSLEKDAAKPYILKDEDILFARSGASVGKTFYYRSFYGESAFAGYLIRASFNNSIIDPKYAYYNTLGNNYEAWKSRAFSQATIQNIGADKYNEYKLPLPPLCEQKSIINYLDEKCSEIDATIAEKQKQLETLEEYKKSLIFEYVTGKKEVV